MPGVAARLRLDRWGAASVCVDPRSRVRVWWLAPPCDPGFQLGPRRTYRQDWL